MPRQRGERLGLSRWGGGYGPHQPTRHGLNYHGVPNSGASQKFKIGSESRPVEQAQGPVPGHKPRRGASPEFQGNLSYGMQRTTHTLNGPGLGNVAGKQREQAGAAGLKKSARRQRRSWARAQGTGKRATTRIQVARLGERSLRQARATSQCDPRVRR